MRIFRFQGPQAEDTGLNEFSGSEQQWAALQASDELRITSMQTIITSGSKVVIRYNPLYESLTTGALRVSLDPDLPDDRRSEAKVVTNVRLYGRQRFIELELV